MRRASGEGTCKLFPNCASLLDLSNYLFPKEDVNRYAMLSTMELKPKIEDTALEGFRKEPGFKGFLALREEQVSSAHLVTLWETMDQLLAARAKAASQKRRDDLAQLLPTPLKQRLCQVLLDTRL